MPKIKTAILLLENLKYDIGFVQQDVVDVVIKILREELSERAA